MEYNGEKRNDEFHGKGKLINETGDVYEGDFQFGEYHGHGKFTMSNNDIIWEGKWVRGELIEGSIRSKKLKFLYEGEIKNLGRHGKGIDFHYKKKRKFIAYWKDDKLEEEYDWDCEIIE